MNIIEVYADVWCPFAHVGLRGVVERRAAMNRSDMRLNVRAWPLELVNRSPLDPAITARHVEELRSQVAPDLFRRFDPENFPRTTLPSLALAHAAYGKDMGTGEAVSLALRDALFEDGLDISRLDVLSHIAKTMDVGPLDVSDERSILSDWHAGVARGVKGSPHFFCGDSDAFCPSLDIATDGSGGLEVRRNVDALDGFLASCAER